LVLAKVAVRKRGADAQGVVEVDWCPWGEDAFTKAWKLRINPSFCQVSSSHYPSPSILLIS
jgi:hypothetical protein